MINKNTQKIFQKIYEIDQKRMNGENWDRNQRTQLFQQLDKIYGVGAS